MKNRTRRCAIHLRDFSFAQHPILKFRGKGIHIELRRNQKASSQTADAVVAEWQTACETNGFAILSQTVRSVPTLPANISKHQPARKRLKKSTLAATTLTCCVFRCTNLEQTRNTRPIGQFTMAGTLQVAKLWHAGFSYVQTLSKPCSTSNLWGPTMPAGAI